MNTIETRVPSAEAWVKTVTDVSELAKTGHDWSGEFLQAGKLTDMEPGSMVITCDTGGSRKHPTKIVKVWVLRSTGKWSMMAKVVSKEWAYEMRDEARRLLAMSDEERVIAAFEKILENYNAERAEHAGYVEKNPSGTEYSAGQIVELDEKIKNSTAALKKFRASLSPVTEEVPAANPLADFSTEQLREELRRRGFAVQSLA